MELNEAEKMLLEFLQEKDTEAQRQSQIRMIRILTVVRNRLLEQGHDIPLDALNINTQTGVITDNRIVAEDPMVRNHDPSTQ